MPAPIRPLVAVFNSSDDMLELFRIVLEQQGFLAVTRHVNELRRGEIDIEAFVSQHQPAVVLYDLVPPYDRQWAFLDRLRATSPFKDLPFVLTSTNAKMALELAGRREPVIEVLGRPVDLDEVVAAIRRALEG
jgi:CheY-like chemotaxis protein